MPGQLSRPTTGANLPAICCTGTDTHPVAPPPLLEKRYRSQYSHPPCSHGEFTKRIYRSGADLRPNTPLLLRPPENRWDSGAPNPPRMGLARLNRNPALKSPQQRQRLGLTARPGIRSFVGGPNKRLSSWDSCPPWVPTPSAPWSASTAGVVVDGALWRKQQGNCDAGQADS